MNLVEGLQEELKRNRELLITYKELGPSGVFGYKVIEQIIKYGEKAQVSGDIVMMLKAYQELKQSQ